MLVVDVVVNVVVVIVVVVGVAEDVGLPERVHVLYIVGCIAHIKPPFTCCRLQK